MHLLILGTRLPILRGYCQEHGLTPEIRPDHAQYIASWIKALKNEPQAFVKAFSKATKAVDYLMEKEKKVA